MGCRPRQRRRLPLRGVLAVAVRDLGCVIPASAVRSQEAGADASV